MGMNQFTWKITVVKMNVEQFEHSKIIYETLRACTRVGMIDVKCLSSSSNLILIWPIDFVSISSMQRKTWDMFVEL
jgi:UDP-N-acetylglucosamine 2-epimerase